MPVPSDAPHLPRSAPIEAYGKGGFAFAEMSHRGSLLCLPDAIWAWPVTRPEDIDQASLARVFESAMTIDTLIIGTGTGVWLPPPALREALRAVQGGAGPDADRACDHHLQHHDRRTAARRSRVDRGAMSGVDGNSQDAAFCADLVRSHDFVRYASTLFVPPDLRRALLAIYAFNVEISRVREQVSQPLPGEVRLQWWTDMLAGSGHGGVEGNPVAAELLLAVRAGRLPVERLSLLIDEHQFDLYNDPMPTMAALEGYINDTSSALFSLAAAVAGRHSDEIEHLARHAGLAQGIAQMIAALPFDASRRQLFVPLQLLESHGSGMEEVFAGKQTTQLRAALDQLIGEAQGHLTTALALLKSVPPEARRVFLPLALVRRDLHHMARADTDPFAPRDSSRLRTLWTLWRASRSSDFS